MATEYIQGSKCVYLLPCGRCRLTMGTCPESIGYDKWTVGWGSTKSFDDKNFPFTTMTTSTKVTDEAKDTIEKLGRC